MALSVRTHQLMAYQKELIAIDCEFVSTPNGGPFSPECWYNSEGLWNVTFPGCTSYQQRAGIIAVCNEKLETYKLTIKHRSCTYLVNDIVYKLNGITHDSLIHGLSMEQLKTKLMPVFKRSLIITHSGNNDFLSLGFPKGRKSESLDTYDITSHFKRQDNSAIRLEVIYQNLFKKNFRQEGEAHDPQADAKATLEIYLFMRSHIKFSRYDDRGYYDEETWEYHPGY